MSLYDASLARRGTGLLQVFNAAGVLTAADVHVAQRLSVLGGEADEQVLLAAGLAVRGARHGSVVLDLAGAAQTVGADEEEVEGALDPATLPWPAVSDWVRRCAASPLVFVGEGPSLGKPLRMVGELLWLDRYWRQEQQVADELLARASGAASAAASTAVAPDLPALAAGLARLFPSGAPDDQRRAVAVCALSRLSVLAGGPGTGKTTTVAKLLALLLDTGTGVAPLRVALAAPTGKAAARLQEAVVGAAARLDPADQVRLAGLSASTLHRLLGRRPGSYSRFRHDRTNRLPHDLVVVDETSMVSLTLMARLLEALRPDARLVLVGDPDQLASVEAGAVLGDLVGPSRAPTLTAGFARRLAAVAPLDVQVVGTAEDSPVARLRDSVVVLGTNYRFPEDSAIGMLARAVREGRADDALALLRAGGPVELVEVGDDERLAGRGLEQLKAEVLITGGALIDAARGGHAASALLALESHRLLCAHRIGPRGVRYWTSQVTRWLTDTYALVPRADGHYAGEPLLVTSNDYETGLYNGDTGVVIEDGGELLAVFGRGGEPMRVPLARLSEVRSMHAMTVHRSQGSEFKRVTVLLPHAGSPLGTRETLYTAITRASEQVRVIGSAESFVGAVERRAARATGLGRRLN